MTFQNHLNVPSTVKVRRGGGLDLACWPPTRNPGLKKEPDINSVPFQILIALFLSKDGIKELFTSAGD